VPVIAFLATRRHEVLRGIRKIGRLVTAEELCAERFEELRLRGGRIDHLAGDLHRLVDDGGRRREGDPRNDS